MSHGGFRDVDAPARGAQHERHQHFEEARKAWHKAVLAAEKQDTSLNKTAPALSWHTMKPQAEIFKSPICSRSCLDILVILRVIPFVRTHVLYTCIMDKIKNQQCFLFFGVSGFIFKLVQVALYSII